MPLSVRAIELDVLDLDVADLLTHTVGQMLEGAPHAGDRSEYRPPRSQSKLPVRPADSVPEKRAAFTLAQPGQG